MNISTLHLNSAETGISDSPVALPNDSATSAEVNNVDVTDNWTTTVSYNNQAESYSNTKQSSSISKIQIAKQKLKMHI